MTGSSFLTFDEDGTEGGGGGSGGRGGGGGGGGVLKCASQNRPNFTNSSSLASLHPCSTSISNGQQLGTNQLR